MTTKENGFDLSRLNDGVKNGRNYCAALTIRRAPSKRRFQ